MTITKNKADQQPLAGPRVQGIRTVKKRWPGAAALRIMWRFLRGLIMWFRNLQLYRLGQTFNLSPESLNEKLHGQAFRGCGRMDMSTSGWVPPLGRHSELLVHAADACIMLCLRKGEKIMPAGVINQLLEDRVAEIESAEGREVYRRERRRLKDEVIIDLLPRALTRHTDQYAYIDTRNGLVVVDTPPARNALEFLEAPRRLTDEEQKALGRA